jgi:hypothetical protein
MGFTMLKLILQKRVVEMGIEFDTSSLYCSILLCIYRLMKQFLRRGKMFANNVNIVCLDTTMEKPFDHPVLSVSIIF